ncbi:hypothetical protein BFW01_g626 [Lasiodiplodia theobromae]|nr:hypothetical protein BFW01_g626 [Lasiodiplodia theobromae]
MPNLYHQLPQILVDKLRRVYDGNPSGVDATGYAKLQPEQWEEFLCLLSEHWDVYTFARDGFKFRYNRRKQRLTYSVMPGSLRFKTATFFRDHVFGRLQSIVNHHPPSEKYWDSIRRVVGGLSSFQNYAMDCMGTVILDCVWMCGDGGVSNPCAVLEVTDSKGYHDTKSKVRDVIKDTRGLPGMGIVVNIDLNRDDKKRAFYVFVKQVRAGTNSAGKNTYMPIEDQRGEIEFRDKLGKLCDGELRISVRDFLGIHIARRFHQDCPITQAILNEDIVISHSDLLKFLEKAEEEDRAEDEMVLEDAKRHGNWKSD